MSLVSLCIQRLIPFVDEIYHIPFRLQFRSNSALISDLVPDPANIDPRLWAVLIQIYDLLPPFFDSYTLSLTDTHLPLLQSIHSTNLFSLITILDLPLCPHLTDSTIPQLSFINSLTAFDAAQSTLSPYAIMTLASFKGSWHLRILSLRNCRNITNDAFPHFIKFPLLSVLDLRGTRCNTHHPSLPFQPSSHHLLYHPTPLKSALTTLQSLHSNNLYSSTNPYYLHINALRYRPTHRPQIATVTPQNAFFVFPSNNSKIQVGSTHDIEEKEKELIHQQNKDAWYQKHDLLKSLSRYSMDPNLTPPPPRRVEFSAKRISSTSSITNSSWIGTSKNDLPKQNKSRHSLPLHSNALCTPIPQPNVTSSASAQSFYNPLPKKSSSLLPSRTRSYDDNYLKLYRPAPPWSTLNEHLTQIQMDEAAAIERQEQRTRTIPPQEEIARVDMSSAKAMLVKRQLDEWALTQAQIRRDEKEKPMDVRVMDQEASHLSRNPFRRQQGLGKPPQPISTVKVPILAPEVRKAALAREKTESGSKLKRKRIATEEQVEEEHEAELRISKAKNVGRSTSSIKETTSSRGFNWKGWVEKPS